MRHVATAALVVTCAVVALCPADREDADSGDADRPGLAATSDTAEADGGLHAALRRSTLFQPVRALSLDVRFDGDHDVQISAIQLSSPLFEPVPPQPRDPVLRAGGGPVTMPLQFGAVRCEEEADGPAQLIADVAGEEVLIPIDESPAGLLGDLHAAECAVAAVMADVELRFGDDWVHTAPRTAEGEVEVIQRHPGVTATVEELRGNVIFTVDAGDEPDPLIEVSDDRPSDGVAVAITASRCDSHALIEYKRTFTFIAMVRIGDDEPVRIDVQADGEALRVLNEVRTACLE
jgi:hypothetical protein